MRRIVTAGSAVLVLIAASVPFIASCDQQMIAAPAPRSCAIVHVTMVGARVELRANASPAAMDEAIRQWRSNKDASPHVGGGLYFYGVNRILAVEGCAR